MQINQAYYDVLQYQALVKVSEQNLARAQENTQRTKDFVAAGSLIPADVATAEVQEANQRLNLLNNQNSLQIAQAGVTTLVGLDPGVLITVAEDEAYQLYQQRGTIERIEMSIEDAIQIALKQSPRISRDSSTAEATGMDTHTRQIATLARLNADVDYNVNLDNVPTRASKFLRLPKLECWYLA